MAQQRGKREATRQKKGHPIRNFILILLLIALIGGGGDSVRRFLTDLLKFFFHMLSLLEMVSKQTKTPSRTGRSERSAVPPVFRLVKSRHSSAW